jgi:hypothetical protein
MASPAPRTTQFDVGTVWSQAFAEHQQNLTAQQLAVLAELCSVGVPSAKLTVDATAPGHHCQDQ